MKTPIPVELASGQVLVVGDAMLDQYWFGDVERISPEAPVPVVHVQKREERLGGAANVARNVASLGPRTALLSATGQDEPGRTLMRLLGEAHIEPLVQADARPDFLRQGRRLRHGSHPRKRAGQFLGRGVCRDSVRA